MRRVFLVSLLGGALGGALAWAAIVLPSAAAVWRDVEDQAESMAGVFAEVNRQAEAREPGPVIARYGYPARAAALAGAEARELTEGGMARRLTRAERGA